MLMNSNEYLNIVESIKQEIQQSQMSLEEQLKAAQQKALQAQP